MLHSVLKAKGKQLASKFKKRLHWWSRKRWHSVIFIIPKLTEDAPLWSRDETSLASIRLFGLAPEQLQVKLQYYWSKPGWQQWFQRWFSTINQQLKIWSYYQQCLAFREIQKEKPEIRLSRGVTVSVTVSQSVIEKLADWLIKSELQFENHLSKHSARWLTQHLESELIHYETKCQRKFLAKLQKEVKKLSRNEAMEVTELIQEDYEKTSNKIRAYLSKCYEYTYLHASQTHASVTETSVVPVVGSSKIPCDKQIVRPLAMAVANVGERGLSSQDASQWINDRRERIRTILEKNEHDVSKQVANFLGDSLNTLISFIDFQLVPYQKVINEVLKGEVDCQAAIEFTRDLQSQLSKLFRKSSLLFHPDSNFSKEWVNELTPCCNTFFSSYKAYLDKSLGKLDKGQKQLEEYVSQVLKKNKGLEAFHLVYEKLKKDIDELARERHAFRKEMEAKLNEQKEKAKEREDKLKKEIEGKLKEQKIQLNDQEEKINQLLQWMKCGLASSASNQVQETILEEKSTQKEEAHFLFQINGNGKR